MFAGWGSRVARLRWPVLVATLVAVLGAGLWGMGVFGQLTEGGYADPTSESGRAADVVAQAIGGQGGDVIAIYTPVRGTPITDAALTKRIKERLSSLPADAVTASASYWDKKNPAYAAEDKSSAVAVITLAGDDPAAKTDAYAAIEDRFAVDGATVQLAGSIPLTHASNQRSTDDLGFAELISMPVVLILLLFIFGSLVAASLPVLVGGAAVLGSLGVLHAIALGTEVNSFAVNVASLLGLGMAIDYGLFMVGRFREEQAAGHDPAEAVRRTVATAGRTVVFSATLLMTALATLLLFPQGFLKSLAYGGLAAVFLAMLLSLTLLPAILAILGPRVDKLPIRLPFRAAQPGRGWRGLAAFVLRRPILVAIPILAGLIVLALPVKDVRFGENDERVLPAGDPARVAVETLKTSYPQFSSDGVQVVVRGPASSARDLATEITKIPGVASVDPAGSATGVTVFNAALTSTDSFSAEARQVVDAIRALPAPAGGEILVGGVTARNVDSLDAIADQLPLMIGLLAGATLLLMFLAFGSVLLPIKAVIMSALSLSATFGVLVWLFQQGHGAGWLSVTPAPLEAGIVVLMAAVVFGLSTDYEVFLLSRMVEARARGAATKEAVSTGLTSTGRVISAAALLLIVVTGAFALSAISTMRFIGVGMIVALVLDATVVRMLLVPATLALLGDAAWWAPGPLRRLQEKAGLAEHTDPLPTSGPLPPLSGTPSAAEAQTEILDYAAVAAHRSAALAGSNADTTVLPIIKPVEESLVAAPDETSIIVWNEDSLTDSSADSSSESADDPSTAESSPSESTADAAPESSSLSPTDDSSPSDTAADSPTTESDPESPSLSPTDHSSPSDTAADSPTTGTDPESPSLSPTDDPSPSDTAADSPTTGTDPESPSLSPTDDPSPSETAGDSPAAGSSAESPRSEYAAGSLATESSAESSALESAADSSRLESAAGSSSPGSFAASSSVGGSSPSDSSDEFPAAESSADFSAANLTSAESAVGSASGDSSEPPSAGASVESSSAGVSGSVKSSDGDAAAEIDADDRRFEPSAIVSGPSPAAAKRATTDPDNTADQTQILPIISGDLRSERSEVTQASVPTSASPAITDPADSLPEATQPNKSDLTEITVSPAGDAESLNDRANLESVTETGRPSEAAPVRSVEPVADTAKAEAAEPVTHTANAQAIGPVADTANVKATEPTTDTANAEAAKPTAETPEVGAIEPVAENPETEATKAVADADDADPPIAALIRSQIATPTEQEPEPDRGLPAEEAPTSDAKPSEPLDSDALWAQVEATLAAGAEVVDSAKPRIAPEASPAAERAHDTIPVAEIAKPTVTVVAGAGPNADIDTKPSPDDAEPTVVAEADRNADISTGAVPAVHDERSAASEDKVELTGAAPVSAIPAAVADAFTWMSDPRIAGIVGTTDAPSDTAVSDFPWLTGPTTILPTTGSAAAEVATESEPTTEPEPTTAVDPVPTVSAEATTPADSAFSAWTPKSGTAERPTPRRPQTLDDWLGAKPPAPAGRDRAPEPDLTADRQNRPATLGDFPTPPRRRIEPVLTEEAANSAEATEPATAEPATAEPVTAGPTAPGPATTEPNTAEPVTAGPSTPGPTTTEPATAEPATAGPTTTEPATTGPTTTEPTTTGPSTPASAAPTPEDAVSKPVDELAVSAAEKAPPAPDAAPAPMADIATAADPAAEKPAAEERAPAVMDEAATASATDQEPAATAATSPANAEQPPTAYTTNQGPAATPATPPANAEQPPTAYTTDQGPAAGGEEAATAPSTDQEPAAIPAGSSVRAEGTERHADPESATTPADEATIATEISIGDQPPAGAAEESAAEPAAAAEDADEKAEPATPAEQPSGASHHGHRPLTLNGVAPDSSAPVSPAAGRRPHTLDDVAPISSVPVSSVPERRPQTLDDVAPTSPAPESPAPARRPQTLDDVAPTSPAPESPAPARRPQTLDDVAPTSPAPESSAAGRRPQTLDDVAPISSVPVSSAPGRRPQTLDEWLHGNPAQPRPQSLDDWVTGENHQITPHNNRPAGSAGPRPQSLGDLPIGDNRPVSSAGPRPQSLSDWLNAGEPPATTRRPATLADHFPDPNRARPANNGPATGAPGGDRPTNGGPTTPDLREADPDPTAS
ncbi:hypothetical protein Aiant_74430 [Actinoplanes ianthinogenes]|uniref:SSD domain-containing protein n=1 Tax=Actinoplanes ianthinogenes TaxID=122358 RepID=A0ABM7M5B5_9ACTN|nr:hypothetical protein Aiant_74430 [Actinoplanes ianthinogenes]